jgi:hypothetical protein
VPIVDPVLRDPDAGRSLTIHLDLDRAVLGLADPAGLVVLGLVDRVDRAVLGLAGLVVLGLVDLAGRGVTGLVDRVHLAGLGDLVDLVGRAGLGLMGPVDLAGRVERRTHPGAHTIGVTRKWAAPLTRRTALAFPTMARRLRPGSTGSAGMTDALPEGLHVTGTGRRLRVAGTVLRLPVVGTLHGMGRRAT